MRALAKLLFEAGMLKKMRRTGYPFLGSGGESIADHCFRAALIGYLLAVELDDVDEGKVALLLLHHDLAEARTGDLNYMNKRYCTADEEKALEHATRELPEALAARIKEHCREFNAGESKEAQLAHDADQLDLLIELKEQQDLGNPYAKHWIHYALKRLQTEAARELAHTVLTTDWTDWWFEKRDDLWVRNNHNGD
ncbi:MAG: HD domain-containing protein [Desulfarculaceae bacterium]|nr:HD domain-containing protein [Desulfarculaceae bacterium]